MDVHYPTATEPATTDYVMSIIRDEHRQMCQLDDAIDPDAILTLDTTVADWRDACDLLPWRQLGRAYNAWWDIDCSMEEWRSVLEPARAKRLSDICGLISRHAVRHRIRPVRLLGRECNEAAAFLTVRSLLAKTGADAREITPSASLAPFTRKHYETFLGSISRLAPGALPPIKFRHPVYDATCWLFVPSVLLLLVSTICEWPFATVAGVALLAFSFAMSWSAARCMSPTAVEFGSLQTFRDLTKAITAKRAE